MADAPTHTFAEFPKEEAEAINAELKAVLEKHNATFHIHRSIDLEGRVQAALQLFKVVPLPKDDGVPSPIQANDLKDNGENSNDKTDEAADTQAA